MGKETPDTISLIILLSLGKRSHNEETKVAAGQSHPESTYSWLLLEERDAISEISELT